MCATVRQLVEMGFPRHAVDFAVKELGGGIGDMTPSPESIVGWLLEHQDRIDLREPPPPPPPPASLLAAADAAADGDGDACSEESDSFSDSFEDIDASGASDGLVLGSVQNQDPLAAVAFKRRADFSTNDDYAVYVRDHIAGGMTVRCCRTYEEVHEGDVGRVVKLDRDNLHDLNVQVDWQRKGGTYWVRYIHIELLAAAAAASSASISGSAATPIKVGDRVRVKPSVSNPKYKWGVINHLSVGVVTAIEGRDVTVDFPQQNHWVGVLSEMEPVPSCHPGVTCDGCQTCPIAGARFRCKVCDNFDFCEKCFYGSRNRGHKHTFARISDPGGAAVFAGRPGRLRGRRASDIAAKAAAAGSGLAACAASATSLYSASSAVGLVEEWGECVKSMGVSSRESWAFRLTDGTSSYWQSCGTQGKHWIRLEMQEDVAVHTLRIQVDPADSTYMPSVIQVKLLDVNYSALVAA